jgi:hypothetical protein
LIAKQLDIFGLRMNWSNIEKWRKLLKIGTIVHSEVGHAKFKKKIDRGILKLLPFKVSGYFTSVLMRNRAIVA